MPQQRASGAGTKGGLYPTDRMTLGTEEGWLLGRGQRVSKGVEMGPELGEWGARSCSSLMDQVGDSLWGGSLRLPRRGRPYTVIEGEGVFRC